MKRYTPNSATPIGANTMFIQIGKHYTPFSALHQFFPTLPIICAQVAAKHFTVCEIQDTDLTHRLTPLSTHLGFCWTIPLSDVVRPENRFGK